jgi:hypothetical protein
VTADQLASSRDPDGVRRMSRVTRLRRPLAVLGVLGVVAAGTVLGPDLVSTRGSDAPAARPTRLRTDPLVPPATHAAALSWPTRGDLAGDQTFAAAALARVRTERRQTQHLIFAGTLPDGSRLALVAMDRGGPQETSRATADLKAVLARPGADIRSGSVRPVGPLNDLSPARWAGAATDGHVYAVVTGAASSALVDLGRPTDP